MTDVFSEYVTLLDEIEQIPIMARESRQLSTEQRAAAMARVVELVRNRVLPQWDRGSAGREALLDDEDALDALDRGLGAGNRDHAAILAPLDELELASPADAAGVQRLMYAVHDAIAGHFSKTELMLASMGEDEGELALRAPRITGDRWARREHARPSAWFG